MGDIALLTGFGPFGEVADNPSQRLAEQLDGERIGGLRIVSRILPVVFGEDSRIVAEAVAALRPRFVLSLGVAVGSATLVVERRGRNRRRTDAGQQPIRSDGPEAYAATLPVETLVAAIRGAGVPCEPGDDAGDYLCNHLLYTTLDLAVRGPFSFAAGFIHLPQAVETARPDQPALPLATLRRGLRAALAGLAGAR